MAPSYSASYAIVTSWNIGKVVEKKLSDLEVTNLSGDELKVSCETRFRRVLPDSMKKIVLKF